MNKLVRMLRVTRVTRLRLYLDNLDSRTKLTKHDRQRVNYLRRRMNTYIMKMSVFSAARAFFYVILYASVVSNFIGDMVTPSTSAWFSRFASPIIVLSSILGTTISITYILIFSKFVNTYWEDVRTHASNIIAIYSKYSIKHVEEPLDD